MHKSCALCGKIPQTGKIVVRKGLLKKKGGTGSKTVRWTKRKFLPNLQKYALYPMERQGTYISALSVLKRKF